MRFSWLAAVLWSLLTSSSFVGATSLNRKIGGTDQRLLELAKRLPNRQKPPLPFRHVRGFYRPHHEIEVHDGSATVNLDHIDALYQELVTLVKERRGSGIASPERISLLGDDNWVPATWVSAFAPHLDWQLERAHAFNARQFEKFRPMKMVELALVVDDTHLQGAADSRPQGIRLGSSPVMSTVELNNSSMWSYLSETFMSATQSVDSGNLVGPSPFQALPYHIEKPSQFIFHLRHLPYRLDEGKKRLTLTGRAEYTD